MQSTRVQSASLAPTVATRILRSTGAASSNSSAKSSVTKANGSGRITAVKNKVEGVKSSESIKPHGRESGSRTMSSSHPIPEICSEDAVSASVSVSVNANNSLNSGDINVYEQTSEFNDLEEGIKKRVLQHLESIKERHAQEISSLKKKQWCYHCEREAIFHCCWNSAYCSKECQHIHWKKEHRRVCRR